MTGEKLQENPQEKTIAEQFKEQAEQAKQRLIAEGKIDEKALIIDKCYALRKYEELVNPQKQSAGKTEKQIKKAELNTKKKRMFQLISYIENLYPNVSKETWDEVSTCISLPKIFLEKYTKHLNWRAILFSSSISKKLMKKYYKEITSVINTDDFIDEFPDRASIIKTVVNGCSYYTALKIYQIAKAKNYEKIIDFVEKNKHKSSIYAKLADNIEVKELYKPPHVINLEKPDIKELESASSKDGDEPLTIARHATCVFSVLLKDNPEEMTELIHSALLKRISFAESEADVNVIESLIFSIPQISKSYKKKYIVECLENENKQVAENILNYLI